MGSVRQLTNSAGAVTDTYEYDAFGNLLSKTGTTPNEMLYRGEQWDSDLGLYYLRARYYNPQSGRFMSRDPGDGVLTNPGTLHKYLYTDGDPINGVDPTGWQESEGYAITLGRISANPEVDTAVRDPELAVACLYLWEGSKFYSSELAATYGGQAEQVAPCTWFWNRLPHIPTYGDQPAPFDPEDVITAPGSPWRCDSEDECEAPCPPDSKRDHQKLHRDPGRFGEPPHWDWTDCNGDTWKIYLDGTMGPG